MKSFFRASQSLKQFPTNRSWTRPLRSARGFREQDLVGQLASALKEATRSRNRLTRLAPALFSAHVSAADSKEERDRFFEEYVDWIYRYCPKSKTFLPKPAQPASPNSVKKLPEIPADEKGTPLESPIFQSLPPDKKIVIKEEFAAWKTFDRSVQRYKASLEKLNPGWQEEDSLACASLRAVWSRYHESRLGLGSNSAKGFCDAQSQEVAPLPAEYDPKCIVAEGLEKYGPPPDGMSVIEHIVRSYYAEEEKAEAAKADIPSGVDSGSELSPPGPLPTNESK